MASRHQSPSFAGHRLPVLQHPGPNFLVVWDGENTTTGRDIRGARVDRSGALVGPVNGFTISDFAGIQADGNRRLQRNDLVVWADLRRYLDADVYGNQITTGGAVKNGNGFVVSGSTTYSEVLPAVGSGTGLTTADGSEAYFLVDYERSNSTTSDVSVRRQVSFTVASK